MQTKCAENDKVMTKMFYTEDDLIKMLKDANVSARADRSFFDENFREIIPLLSDEPSEEERFNCAENISYEVYLDKPIKRMEICLSCDSQCFCKLYQDANDGCVYPMEEGGDPYSEDFKQLLVEKDAAFDGDMSNPSDIVGFVVECPSSEFDCKIVNGDGD